MSALPGLHERVELVDCSIRTRASTATQPLGEREHGIQIELGDLGDVHGQAAPSGARGRPVRAASAGGAPRKPRTSRLPCREHELLGIDVGQRRDPEGGFADQLGEDAAGAERDERAEDRVLDDAGQQLVPPAIIGCTTTGSADPL